MNKIKNTLMFLIVMMVISINYCFANELSGIGGDGNRYTASWSVAGTLAPVPYEYNGQPFFHFTLNNVAWPSSEWGIEQTSWAATCTNGGVLSGIGGDGNRYTASWSGTGTLAPVPYEYNGQPFFHFTLNNVAWPNSEWGVERTSWSVTCNPEPANELSGIGGDGNRYTASWSVAGTLAPVPYEYNGQPFFHFTLNNEAWPNSEWGIEQTSWSATCTNGGVFSGIGGDGNRYTASWSGTGTLAPVPYEYNGQPFFHFTLNNVAWPSSEWGIERTSWSVICNPEPANELSGIGGDGNRYTASWSGTGTLAPVPYEYNGQSFFHFILNNVAWPNSEWGIEQTSWSATCTNGGVLFGIGGDGNRYTASWSGTGTLAPVPYEYNGQPFFHFTLNNVAWPNSLWGIERTSWSVTCNPE